MFSIALINCSFESISFFYLHNFSFIIPHTFSIGERSGLYAGQSKISIPKSEIVSVVFLAVWHGALSY